MRRLHATSGAVAVILLLARLYATAGASGGEQATAISAPGLLGVLAIEDARAPLPDDVRALLAAARSGNLAIQRAAVRALGRLERRDVITDVQTFLSASDPQTRDEAAVALSLALRGPALAGVPADDQVSSVVTALAVSSRGDGAYLALGHLPYTTAGQFRSAEEVLAGAIKSGETTVGPLRGLEALARRNRKLLPFQDVTLDRLRALAITHERARSPDLRRNAVAALIAAQAMDNPTLTAAVNDDDAEVRRLAMLSLAGAGATIDEARGLELLQTALTDRTPMVRLEALKGWVRRGVPEQGCGRILAALADQHPNVFLYALDALADQCKDDIVVTDRLTAEARTPPAAGSWQRQAHAFVSLARRATDRAALVMPAFAGHQRWQVRMYAARAAAAADDVGTLKRLALDDDDNVREATLPALRRLLHDESDDLFVAALGRPNYQLIRTAARELKGSAPSPALATALGGALERVTGEKKETSRDPRMALLERLGELGTDRDAPWLRPLLRDFDPVIATATARLLKSWSGEDPIVEPHLLPRAPLPSGQELGEDVQAVVTMAGGGSFTLQLATTQAPLTRTRFVRLARSSYYDGLTFHRIVANAFIQGGSPGANEYAGDALYMRDEVGLELHTRGSVGISTRGRDTGDAQIFINLVDNPFLDHEYTVFARVCGAGMETVDRIQEGDRIERIQIEKADTCR